MLGQVLLLLAGIAILHGQYFRLMRGVAVI